MISYFKVAIKRLWVHEVLRVYGDRLVDDPDIKWLVEQTRRTISDYMEDSLDGMFPHLLSDKKSVVCLC